MLHSSVSPEALSKRKLRWRGTSDRPSDLYRTNVEVAESFARRAYVALAVDSDRANLDGSELFRIYPPVKDFLPVQIADMKRRRMRRISGG